MEQSAKKRYGQCHKCYTYAEIFWRSQGRLDKNKKDGSNYEKK